MTAGTSRFLTGTPTHGTRLWLMHWLGRDLRAHRKGLVVAIGLKKGRNADRTMGASVSASAVARTRALGMSASGSLGSWRWSEMVVSEQSLQPRGFIVVVGV
mmetsp:Transcript_126643/g.289653  ORF Transcript_126643/g.289653 Transcript_126643/m.289653 type:complete len:102 (+) Transcript_126643:918-1223(+)